MLYTLDTEFIEDGHTIELVSIGLVAQDGRTYYRQVVERPFNRANDWVRQHVLQALDECREGEKSWHWAAMSATYTPWTCPAMGCPWRWQDDIARELIDFVGESPSFLGYYSAYDWVVLCQLYGAMIDLPKGWPMYCHDLRSMLDFHDLQHIKQPVDMPHHALSDAQWIMATYEKHFSDRHFLVS